ncbi:MAG TPA: hypothetical protein VF544_02840 [Pyrinomonadaceae bacterium]
MSLIRFKRRMFLPLLALCCVLLMAGAALAEGQGQPTTASTAAAKDVDLEIKLYLLVGSSGGGEAAKPPAQLDRAVRQLSSSLPFNSYRWAGTFISRVSNGSNSNTKGLAGPLLATTPPTSSTPSFYDLTLNNVSFGTGGDGQEVIRLILQFGARLPITVGGGASGPAAVNYEATGVRTTVSVRENEPVVVGTMSLGASNETLVLVVVARRIS